MEKDKLIELAKLIRYNILRITHKAGSGHPTSSFSAVELMTMLFFTYLRLDTDNPGHITNDRVIISKGHASALLYSLYAAAGVIGEEELLTYREFRSPLEGHPTKRFRFTEAATGSLGQGLSIGAGEAFGLKMIQDSGIKNQDKEKNRESYLLNHESAPRVYVLMGDGELGEGSVWEACAWASFHNLANLIAICDINRFGQSEATMLEYDLETYRRRFEAFGWGAIVVDGHDYSQIDAAFQKALRYTVGPVAILAKTQKGKGITVWEDRDGWHNKMLPPDILEKAIAEFGSVDKNLRGVIQKPELARSEKLEAISKNEPSYRVSLIAYRTDELVPTKKAFGNALERLGAEFPELVVLDGDVSNSLHTDQFKKAFPDRFLQMYIAEQNMVGVAVGLAKLGFKPVVSTFASFLTRAHDQIRMIHLTGVPLYFNGSYVGVSVGRDGPSQMGLEDLALFRAIPGSTVLYPSDAYATERLTEEMLAQKDVVYIRTTRAGTPVLYGPNDEFHVGGSKIFESHLQNAESHVAIVSAGITLHEAIKAQKELENRGIAVRVIDCYSVKPVDEETLMLAAKETKAIVVVEDHYPEGGLGEAVKSALATEKIPIYHLAVRKAPMSGSPEELLAYEEIDAKAIIKTVASILQGTALQK